LKNGRATGRSFAIVTLFFDVLALPAHDDDAKKNDCEQRASQTNDLTVFHSGSPSFFPAF
jgi:hypothetical protein